MPPLNLDSRGVARCAMPLVAIRIIALNQDVVEEGKGLRSEILPGFGEGLLGIRHSFPSQMDPFPVVIPFHWGRFAGHIQNNRYDTDQSHFAAPGKDLRPLS